MTISWTGFVRGNKAAAIKMVVFGPILGALAAPAHIKKPSWAPHTDLEMFPRVDGNGATSPIR